MFLDQLKLDISREGTFDWHTDPTLVFIAESLTRRPMDPKQVAKQFERFYREALAKAPAETLTPEQFNELLAQSPTTQEMHAKWLEFPEPLPGLEAWKGCLIAPMPDPRKVFGPTADNKRPKGICCLMLFGEGHTFLVGYLDMEQGRLDPARIKPHNVSEQALISGSSKDEKQRDIDAVIPLWQVAIALAERPRQGGMDA